MWLINVHPIRGWGGGLRCPQCYFRSYKYVVCGKIMTFQSFYPGDISMASIANPFTECYTSGRTRLKDRFVEE